MNMLWDSTASALVEITKCAVNGTNEVWILPPNDTDHVSSEENEQDAEMGVLKFPAKLLPKWKPEQNLFAHKG